MDRDEQQTGWQKEGIDERLARLETRQETIQEDVEDLQRGQEKILSAVYDLDDQFAGEDWRDEAQSQINQNRRSITRRNAVIKFIILILTILGGFTGLIIALL